MQIMQFNDLHCSSWANIRHTARYTQKNRFEDESEQLSSLESFFRSWIWATTDVTPGKGVGQVDTLGGTHPATR